MFCRCNWLNSDLSLIMITGSSKYQKREVVLVLIQNLKNKRFTLRSSLRVVTLMRLLIKCRLSQNYKSEIFKFPLTYTWKITLLYLTQGRSKHASNTILCKKSTLIFTLKTASSKSIIHSTIWKAWRRLTSPIISIWAVLSTWLPRATRDTINTWSPSIWWNLIMENEWHFSLCTWCITRLC